MNRIIYLLLLTVMLSCGQQSEQDNETTQIQNKDKMMNANKDLVRLWLLEGWNKNRNEEVVKLVFSEDWVTTSTALDKQPRGTEGAMYWVHEFRKVFSDVHFEITHLVADTEYVTARFTCVARHTGTFLDIPATNKILSTAES
jgi:predicted ester cyclase